ncbi:FtsX-like permease family protein [Flammeovirgaceae bacterium SG7u.111]|nr:FtsX-like permease family protein [Flammeovirgaceae bacterium SG7u.132]WPO36501.1 FtsX-like permease family protein [Flammeovirgaceae bacterium SG7u.111]
MKLLVKLAWRNIWRNKRRTIITLSSIFFAVLLALFMRSMQRGSYQRMIENSVEMHSGYIQVHRDGYWDNKSINKLLEENEAIGQKLVAEPKIDFYIPRLENFALAASEKLSKGAMVVGTAPEEENRMTKLADKVKEGRYFTTDDNHLLIAKGLAGYLKLGVGDTLVLIGQGYHGNNAVGKFPICGIVDLPNPTLNNSMVYMPIALNRDFNSAPGMATALVIALQSYQDVEMVEKSLRASLDEEYEVMGWDVLQPELVQLIQSDNAGGIIMIIILYIVIAFGIFGTIMMMTVERIKEFGVLIAIGLQKTKLISLVFIETLLIGIVGLLASLLVGIPLLYYMYLNPIYLTGDAAEGMQKMGLEPIMPFSLQPAIFTSQMIAIGIIVFICLLYPLSTIRKIHLIDALRA